MDDSGLHRIRRLGDGGYSKVYEGRRKDSLYAIKRNLVFPSTTFIGSLKELDLLNKLRHPCIVNLESISFGNPFSDSLLSPLRGSSASYRDDSIHFIFENAFADGYSLVYDISTSLDILKSCMVDMMLGLEYMHIHNIIHRDLKPANVLLFNHGGIKAKLCDLGISKPYTRQGRQTPGLVTPWYRAPEVCK